MIQMIYLLIVKVMMCKSRFYEKAHHFLSISHRCRVWNLGKQVEAPPKRLGKHFSRTSQGLQSTMHCMPLPFRKCAKDELKGQQERGWTAYTKCWKMLKMFITASCSLCLVLKLFMEFGLNHYKSWVFAIATWVWERSRSLQYIFPPSNCHDGSPKWSIHVRQILNVFDLRWQRAWKAKTWPFS